MDLTISREDDTKWPEKNKDGRQELEIRLGNEHISFEVRSLYARVRMTLNLLTGLDRRPRSDHSLTLLSLPTRRDCEFSIISCKISKLLCSR